MQSINSTGPTAQLPGALGERGVGRSPAALPALGSYGASLYPDPDGTRPHLDRVSGASPVPACGTVPLWVEESGSPVSNTGDRTYSGDLSPSPASTVGLDWLHLSGPSEYLLRVLRLCRELFGIQRDQWAEDKGLMFYKDTYRHPLGLILCYTRDPKERNGEHCTLVIPGTAFQVLGMEQVLCLNTELYGCGFRATRVDVRRDWHGKSITLIEDMTNACRAGELCRLRSWRPMEEYGRDGRTAYGCNLGKRESPVFYRFYDKGLEQGDRPEGEWVRLELELKGDRAAAFMLDLAKLAGSGYFDWDKLAGGVLFGHVDFRDGARDQRISTRTQSSFWRELIGDLHLVTYMPERTKTTMDRHWAWLNRCVLPCLQAIMENADYDPEQLWDVLSADLEPMADAMLRPVVYEYVRHLKLGREAGPVWFDGRGAA